jgi:hypothetical protein
VDGWWRGWGWGVAGKRERSWRGGDSSRRRRHESGGGEGAARGKGEVRVAATCVFGLPNDGRIRPRVKMDVGGRPGENGGNPVGFLFPKGPLVSSNNGRPEDAAQCQVEAAARQWPIGRPHTGLGNWRMGLPMGQGGLAEAGGRG